MLEVGQIIDGKYRVERLLGKGGMGAVYEGYHTLVERRVAIKVLLAEMTASGEGVARFEREVRATGRIGNEHLLEVFDVGRLPDGSRYMVSEYLDGETLSSRLEKTGSLTPRETAKITLELLDGLTAAHEAGVVHRDLKPDNIFLLRRKGSQSDFVKIIDFGVSKFQFEDNANMSMTATGAVLGTPYYLSPEQARGMRDIDARSDLYTVGVIMYQAVAGHVPIHAETFNELLFKIALQDAPNLKSELPQVDPYFDTLVSRAMARERDARFGSAREMHAALSAWLAASATTGSASGPSSGAQGGVHATAAPPLPTASNFGSTSAVSAFEERSRPRPSPLLFGLIGLGVLIAGGAAAFAFHVSGSKPPATASAVLSAVSVPSAPPATAAPVIAPLPNTAPVPPSARSEPPLATGRSADEANAAPLPKPVRAPARGSTRRLAATPTPTPTPTPVKAVTAEPPPASPSPKPAAPARRERDFGY